ncbi:MAG: hypothetical protein ACRDDZ_09720 [Marinifilaceae bacterium]
MGNVRTAILMENFQGGGNTGGGDTGDGNNREVSLQDIYSSNSLLASDQYNALNYAVNIDGRGLTMILVHFKSGNIRVTFKMMPSCVYLRMSMCLTY